MENMDKKECGCGDGKCMCGGAMGYRHGCHGRHHLVKIILKLVILIIVFWCGYHLGMMTGFLKAEYGRGMMTRDMSGYGTMRGGYLGGASTVSPATPVTPVPAQ